MSVLPISAEALHAIVESGLPEGSSLVDVRSKEECLRGMIAGAKNIPVETVVQNPELFSSSKKVYFYCLSGGRSQMAGAALDARGFGCEVYSLTNGLLAWRKNGYAIK